MYGNYRTSRQPSSSSSPTPSRSASEASYDLEENREDRPLEELLNDLPADQREEFEREWNNLRMANRADDNEQEAPPPYPGQGNNPHDLMNMIHRMVEAQQGFLQAQQTQQQAQAEADDRIREAHRLLGDRVTELAGIVENVGRGTGGTRHTGRTDHLTFKPSMFRPLDMKAVNKENKLLSEEFMSWKININRVLKANPAAASLPIDRLTALILAGIGDKAEKRLTGLGQNPTFNSLEEFFNKMQAIFCSSTVQTDAEEQFHKMKQYTNEDLHGWHTRCLLYFRLAFPTQDYWTMLLKKFFQGMANRKLAEKTMDNISNRPGGWEALCDEDGFDACLSLAVKCDAFAGLKAHVLDDKSNRYHRSLEGTSSQDLGVPMDTNSVHNQHRQRGSRYPRPTTATVASHNYGQGRTEPQTNRRNNPPGGTQKKLQQEARNQRSQGRSYTQATGSSTARYDRSKDRCLKCNNFGHWKRDCTVGATETLGESTALTVIPETESWADTNIVSAMSPNREADWPALNPNASHPN